MVVGAERGYAKGRVRREEILDAAVELFGEVGYRSASLREIAQRVGISHPGLLHHFASKDLILAAVLERRDRLDEERFDLAGSGGEELLRHVVELVADNAANPGIVKLFVALSAEATAPDHPAHDYLLRHYQRSLAQFETGLAPLEAAGRLRAGLTARRFAIGLLAMMDGLQIQWLLDEGSLDMAAEVSAFIDASLVQGPAADR